MLSQMLSKTRITHLFQTEFRCDAWNCVCFRLLLIEVESFGDCRCSEPAALIKAKSGQSKVFRRPEGNKTDQ